MAAIPSMGRTGLVASADASATVAWSPCGTWPSLIRQAASARQTRRAAAIGNLVVMACLGASQLPRTGFDPQGFASMMAPAVDAGPWLLILLIVSSAAASMVLLTSDYTSSALVPAARVEPVLSFDQPIADASQQGPATQFGLSERMGHELRTPLTAIIGFSDMMRCELHGPLGSDRYQSYAGHIRDSGVSLLQAIETAMASGRMGREGTAVVTPVGETPTLTQHVNA